MPSAENALRSIEVIVIASAGDARETKREPARRGCSTALPRPGVDGLVISTAAAWRRKSVLPASSGAEHK